MERKLRSSDILVKIGEGSDHEIEIRRTDPLDFTKAQLLPDVRHIVSRYFTLLQDTPQKQIDRDKTVRQSLSSEIWNDWIFMNLPPVSIKNVGLKLEKLVNNARRLMKYPVNKRGSTWVKDMQDLCQQLQHGWDIRSSHPKSIAILTEDYQVEIGDEEESLYTDNCVPVEGVCPRKMVVGGTDQAWLKGALERLQKIEKKEKRDEKREEKAKKVKEALEKIRDENFNSILVEEDMSSADMNENDETFKKPNKLNPASVALPKNSTSRCSRSSSISSPSMSSPPSAFPDMPCRSGYKNIHPSIIEVMVVMESKFKVEQRQVAPLLAYIMNNLAGQHWEVPSEETDILENNEKDSESVRNRRPSRDLTHVLPSRKTLRKRLEDASLLNFQFAAKAIQEANDEGGTVTLGVDDTVKASRFRVHDVKTGRITIVNKKGDLNDDDKTNKPRQTFTTGFLPNISHSGQHSAVNVRTWISQMAVLCEVQYEEMFDFFNFFMNDRVSDSDAMLRD